ncbi:MAG: hypothetical protein AB2693_29540, partial [Candidatus Thiodiazotropha sp.]
FSPLLNIEQDNPRPWPGKKKATSPLEAEASSKKQRDETRLAAEPIPNEQLNTESATPVQNKQTDQSDNQNSQSEDYDDHSNVPINNTDIEEPKDSAMEAISNDNSQYTEHEETQTHYNTDETHQPQPDTD